MTPTRTPTAKIIWPSTPLAGCLFCTIVRDTRATSLGVQQRFNFFPASPLCCVTVIAEGAMNWIAAEADMAAPWSAPPLPDFAFSGAQLGPLVSWSTGEIHAVTVCFYPDAFSAMTGLDLSPFVGRIESARDVLPAQILAPCAAFDAQLRRDGLEAALATLEVALREIWSNARPRGAGPVRWLDDWTRRLIVRAAMSGTGRSTRQVARRIRSWAGVSERDLRGLGQSEQLYAKIHEGLDKGGLDWAELAADSGFADQAHMIRRMRQHTGFTPEQLRRLAPSEEALWGYRLLGEYFAKPGYEHGPVEDRADDRRSETSANS